MGDYSKFISPKRRSVLPPQNFVNNGECIFGTFSKEFESIVLTDIKKPTYAPDFMNKLKLTLWEACEISFDAGVLFVVVADMDIFGMTFNIFYDKETKKVHEWIHSYSSKKVDVACSLINGSKTTGKGSHSFIEFINNFQDGKCDITGESKTKESVLSYSIKLDRVSLPSIVSIPFADPEKKKRPLYSQKDLFKAEGRIIIDDKEYVLNEKSYAVIDDHKGFYPRKMHYDWLSTFGIFGNELFGMNITSNQSVDPENYNENLIWLKNKTSLLPPVKFARDNKTIKAVKGEESNWTINDTNDSDMINLQYKVVNLYHMIVHLKPIINIDYFITFGLLNGYVRDEDGKKYEFKDVLTLGEDKSMIL